MPRIVITSRTFYPDIGGGETNAELLAREFTAAGYQVRVITQTGGDELDAAGKPFPFAVVRRPSAFALIRQIAWADVVLQNGISLRYAWPLMVVRRPLVIRHLVWIRQQNETLTWQIWLKMFLLRFAHSISISQAIADHLPVASQVIGNPYRHRLFRKIEGIERDRDIAFLGRLVSDKGADVLIRAVAELRELGTVATATLIGKGPEEPRLRELARELEVEHSVCFAGVLLGDELVKLLNAHKVLVIPSTWNEPFGVVALEGAACGCVVVGSDGGGLLEAIGPCGETFPIGDHKRLAALLRDLLSDEPRLQRYRNAAPAHLANHRADQVALEYIAFVEGVLRASRQSTAKPPAIQLSRPMKKATSSASNGLSLAIFARFHPSIGGIETVAELLAREWVAAGHRVTMITEIAAEPGDTRQFPFRVLRRPGARTLLRAIRDCDVVIHHQISLKAIWPFMFVRRPLVAVHHSMYRSAPGRRPWREAVKVWIARHLAHSVSVSRAVEREIGCSGVVIPNLYDDQSFYDANRERTKDLVFLGRLVSDKGANVLLDALGELRSNGLRPMLTFIGDGPERTALESQTGRLGLDQQVAFTGFLDRDQIARVLNEHKLLIVPSLWDEPFGIVALEGAACGCVVVGSDGGGLPEAIGSCGLTFPNGDHGSLAEVLEELLRRPARMERFRQAAAGHLAAHRATAVSAAYLEFIANVAGRRRQYLATSTSAHCSVADRERQELKSHVG